MKYKEKSCKKRTSLEMRLFNLLESKTRDLEKSRWQGYERPFQGLG